MTTRSITTRVTTPDTYRDVTNMLKLETIERPNKTTAFDLTVKLASGVELSQVEKCLLVNYFSPPLAKKPKTAFQWVALAAAKKDVREYLKYVYVTDQGEMVASDGERMHYAPTDIPGGFYCPKTGLKVNVDLKFPENWQRIAKESRQYHHKPKEVSTCTARNALSKGITWVTYDNAHATHGWQLSYVNDAQPVEIEVPVEHNGKLHGNSQFGEFVIMCGRLK